ncbi:MAG: asparagine synthase (glutamine-hydrolyzing) [Desulfobulbaceae bacterium A2]|nr:MAG: asparagine synthase (glutamine-hydrolyzing) [Desulfobulbaceae bacterium A2]
MCGIAGCFLAGGVAPDPAALQAASAAIAHRGPDDSGVFVDQAPGIGLVHARLSILDLSPLGHQPMSGADGAVVLVFNGEIYNFRELRHELIGQGVAFRGQSDTEVLLQMYLAEGEAMLPRLNGIFAFALWDSRSQTLLLARDALGVKPLYYAAMHDGFFFASEIKALTSWLPNAPALDLAALRRYLSFLWCPGEGTPFQAVRKVLPGEAVQVRQGRIERRWRWYRLPSVRGVVADLKEEDALAGTLAHLRQAVRRQLVADVPVGAFLSGGLDSSAIVALAREEQPDIRCFTIEAVGGQEEGATDDLPYARRVAKHLHVPLEVISIDAGRMADDLERMVVQLDEPLADPAPLNVLYICQLARQHGMKVLLSGAGGDDLFSGYRRHRALELERYWNWLPVSCREGIEGMAKGLNQRRAWARRLRKFLNGAGLDGDERLVHYFVWAGRDDLVALYSPAFRSTMGDAVAEAPMLEFLAELHPAAGPLERMLALEQRFFLADHNLIYTDKMSMATGVEVRVPFLDLEMVEFAARIPAKLKQRGRIGKWVLKKAMEPYLPHDVIYRPKTGFGAPLRRWMRHELRELLGDLLSPDSLKRRGLFEPFAVQRLISANDSGRVDASYTLLSLVCIEIWCRAYLDRSGAAPAGWGWKLGRKSGDIPTFDK